MMRILNNDTDKKNENITLCLTKAEALELKDTIEQLLNKPLGNHGHVSDFDYGKELGICIYDESDIDPSFHDRIKKLIRENE